MLLDRSLENPSSIQVNYHFLLAREAAGTLPF